MTQYIRGQLTYDAGHGRLRDVWRGKPFDRHTSTSVVLLRTVPNLRQQLLFSRLNRLAMKAIDLIANELKGSVKPEFARVMMELTLQQINGRGEEG